ncbi:MAG: hypothetical protein AB8B71_09240 [Paracoccaceae bacterium]
MSTQSPPDDQAADALDTKLTMRASLEEDTDVQNRLTELTIAKVGELARKEIEIWKKEQDEKAPRLLDPKSWGNRTLGGAIAGGLFAIGAVVFGFFGHEDLKIWHTPERISGLARAEIDQAFLGNSFQSAVRTQLSQVASSEMTQEDGISRLIKKQMKAMPLLTFHGRETFGETLKLSIPDPECEARVEKESERPDVSEFDDLPRPTPSGQLGTPPALEDQCISTVSTDIATALDIPFLARFFPKDDSKVVHSVSLMLFIERKHEAIASAPYAQVEPGRPMNEPLNATDGASQPAGLCVIYRPANEANPFAKTGLLVDRWTKTRDGHWIADLTEILKTAEVFSEDDRAAGDISHLHSVFIKAVLQAGEAGPNACSSIVPVEHQTLSVSAIVLVNNDLYFGRN